VPYLRPGFLLRRILNPALRALGVVPVLIVRGRSSGQPRAVAVLVLEMRGGRYLVAPRGDTQWARNLRAAGGGELRRRGKTEHFKAAELPDAEKPALIDAYLKRWGWMVRAQFDQLPEPSQHPVFRIERGA